MSNDAAIDEVRRARTQLSRELGNNPRRFFEYFSALRKQHLKEGRIYVEPPKRTAELKEDSSNYSPLKQNKNPAK